jgi:serine/threonine-protein kinase
MVPMDTERFKQIEAIFDRALGLSGSEREEYLAEACGGDASLRREVETLLSAHGEAGDFLEQPAVEHGIDLSSVDPGMAGSSQRVGHYRLLRKIGEGGMSEVYLAVRADDEYQKRVALKVVRQDIDREDMLRRFRTERQILAGLDHANIATLLDGGTTDEGRPYFVMDYIEGVPLDEYCDRNRLSVRERLNLFQQVCSAVEYAHRNLVVHRDIKANNILVTAEGVPKLLDFGIAKLLKPDQFAQQVEYTATWMRPMTPQYASPEQIQGKPITTSSDVYSLGVLLYKLLTGHLPYRLRGRHPTEFARIVAEEEPDRPSTAITHPEEPVPGEAGRDPVTAETVSWARSTQPGQLRRLLTGDLDNIVLMALRKEPQRRYRSVEQFSDDIQRYQTGLPVIARKDTLGYRAGKFLSRNWLGVAAAVAFLALLTGFSIAMALQASRIARERDQARRERDRAERVVGFMEEIFQISDPVAGTGENVSAREILARGAERVVSELDDQPDVKATLLAAIGTVNRNLGLFDRARPLLEQALETRRGLFGEEHPLVAESLHDLAVCARLMGDIGEAEQFHRQALELRRSLLGEQSPETVETLNDLGIVLRQKGDFKAAESVYREALRIQQETQGDKTEQATGKNNLATLLIQMGDPTGAEILFRESLDLRREMLDPKHPLVAQNLSNLGASLGMQGKYDEAEPYLREALEIYREVLDEEHPSLVEGLNNLAKLLQRKGDHDAAEPLYREALRIERKRVGGDHLNVVHLLTNLAGMLQEKGDLAAAEDAARESIAVGRRSLGNLHPVVGSALVRLGSVLIDTGRSEDAEAMIREALDIYRASLSEDHWRQAEARSLLGHGLAAMGRFSEGEPMVLEGYEGLRAGRGESHRATTAALGRVVGLYEAWGRPEEAARYRGKLPD